MDTSTDALEDYLGQSIAGFKQAQTFYEKVRSYLNAKERLSAKEVFLLMFFDSFRSKELVESMKEATNVDDLYERLIQGKYFSNKFDYDRLVDLEKRLNEAKAKSEVIDLMATEHTGGSDMLDAAVSHTTIYLDINVKEWYFKGTALQVIPEGIYRYITKHYVNGRLKEIEDCGPNDGGESCHSGKYKCGGSGRNCRGGIVVDDPASHRVEISSSHANGGKLK